MLSNTKESLMPTHFHKFYSKVETVFWVNFNISAPKHQPKCDTLLSGRKAFSSGTLSWRYKRDMILLIFLSQNIMWFQINYCGAKSNEGGIIWTSPWRMSTISTVKDEGRCKKDEPWTRKSIGLIVTYKAHWRR